MENFLNSLLTPPVPNAVLQAAWILPAFIVLLVWSFAWKGWALWRAARDASKVWFVVLLLVNTVGILEIIYIFGISKRKAKTEPQPAVPQI